MLTTKYIYAGQAPSVDLQGYTDVRKVRLSTRTPIQQGKESGLESGAKISFSLSEHNYRV